MSRTAAEIAAAGLGLAFAWAGLAKLMGFPRWRGAPIRLGLPGGMAAIAGFVVPVVELGTATLLLVGPPVAGAAVALALLTAFSVVLLRARALRGDRLPCACFGGSADWDYRLLLARNAALAVPAVLVLSAGKAGRGLDALGSPGAGDALPLALAALGFLVAIWTIQQARTALRREDFR